jgi:hypothetical protein
MELANTLENVNYHQWKKEKEKGIYLHHQHQEPWEVQILYGNFAHWMGVSTDQ